MLMASLPIAVVMQRSALNHRWASEAWSAIGVVADGGLPPFRLISRDATQETYLVAGLSREPAQNIAGVDAGRTGADDGDAQGRRSGSHSKPFNSEQ